MRYTAGSAKHRILIHFIQQFGKSNRIRPSWLHKESPALLHPSCRACTGLHACCVVAHFLHQHLSGTYTSTYFKQLSTSMCLTNFIVPVRPCCDFFSQAWEERRQDVIYYGSLCLTMRNKDYSISLCQAQKQYHRERMIFVITITTLHHHK